MSDDTPNPTRDRERFAERLREADLDDQRFIDVLDGEKRTLTRGHNAPKHWMDADKFTEFGSGNYGVHPGAGLDDDDLRLVEFDKDDYHGTEDTSALDELPETFGVNSPHTPPGESGHDYYAATAEAVEVLKELTGTLNPEPAWGEIKAKGKYVVGPGSQLDGCSKEWCDECAKPDGGYYRIANDVPIATLDREQLADVIRNDTEIGNGNIGDIGDTEAGADDSEDENPTSEGGKQGSADAESDESNAPEVMPPCYRLALEARRDPSNATVNEYEVSKHAALLGLWAGYDADAVIGHMTDEYAPGENAGFDLDEDKTEDQVERLEKKTERDSPLRPPKPTKLKQVGILPEIAADSCAETCTIHTTSGGSGESEGAATDGGTAAASGGAGGPAGGAGSGETDGEGDTDGSDSDPWADVRRLYATDENEDDKRATNHAARTLETEIDVRTHDESEALYHYDDSDGIYHPQGTHRVQEFLDSDEKMGLTFYPSRARNIGETLKYKTYTPESEFGAPENRMCFANGVLDVSEPAGPSLGEHSPEHLFTSGHPVEFDPDADCPEFMEFIEKVVRDEDRKKLQEYAGYCLHTWDQPFKKALMLVGPTNSGKGTFLRIIEDVIGAENTSNETLEDLVESRWSGAQLYHGVANIRNEMSTSKLKHTERFKEMTGRGDRMSAESKFEQKFTFQVTQKFLFATNEVPEVDSDDAFNNRWLFAAFPHTVPEPQIDTELAERISENELSGVLNWMLDGYGRLLENGRFSEERGIEEKEEMWEKYGSTVDRFKHACLTVTGDEDDLLRKDDIRPLYKAFCARIGKDAEQKQTVTKELTSDADIEHGKRTIPGDGSQSDCYIGVTADSGAFDDLDVTPFGPDGDDNDGRLSDY